MDAETGTDDTEDRQALATSRLYKLDITAGLQDSSALTDSRDRITRSQSKTKLFLGFEPIYHQMSRKSIPCSFEFKNSFASVKKSR